jgi:hypothetical protein
VALGLLIAKATVSNDFQYPSIFSSEGNNLHDFVTSNRDMHIQPLIRIKPAPPLIGQTTFCPAYIDISLKFYHSAVTLAVCSRCIAVIGVKYMMLLKVTLKGV